MDRVIRVAHFYHWTLPDVRRMRVHDFEACHMMISRLRAESNLMQMSIAQYPHSKDDYRKKLHKEIYTLANPVDPDAPVMSTGDLAKMLALGGSNG